VGDSKINIIGEGVDATIIDFEGGAYSVKYQGHFINISPGVNDEEYKTNFRVEGLTIKNSNDKGGLYIQYADFWNIANVRLDSNDQNGFYMDSCQYFTLNNVSSDNNTESGFLFYGDEDYFRQSAHFTVNNCNTTLNTGSGFTFSIYGFSGADAVDKFILINCVSFNDDGNGFEFIEATNNSSSALDAKMIGCLANSAGDYSLLIEPNISNLIVVGSIFGSATIASVLVEGDFNFFIACDAAGRYQGGAYPGWKITGQDNLLVASSFSTQSIALSTLNEEFNEIIDSKTISKLNKGGSFATSIDLKNVSNTSGGALAVGDVVVHKSAASGDEVTTTTTQGDDKVCGMLLDALADDADGKLLIEGKTKLLKVNGTTNIAVGDFLCTYTVAGISAKAGAGDMCFAISLEAYSTADSSGVIDALLISPRKI